MTWSPGRSDRALVGGLGLSSSGQQQQPLLSMGLQPSTSAPAVAGAGMHGGSQDDRTAWSRVQQLSQRVAHLEADLTLLRRRKTQLERENEVLAASTQQPELEARLERVEARLEMQLEANARLEEENRRHVAESSRRAALEKQQAEIARSFSELQGVVSQLVRRLVELDAQRQRLEEQKNAAEAVAASLQQAGSKEANQHHQRKSPSHQTQGAHAHFDQTRPGRRCGPSARRTCSPPPRRSQRGSTCKRYVPQNEFDALKAESERVQEEAELYHSLLQQGEIDCAMLRKRFAVEEDACAKADAADQTAAEERRERRRCELSSVLADLDLTP